MIAPISAITVRNASIRASPSSPRSERPVAGTMSTSSSRAARSAFVGSDVNAPSGRRTNAPARPSIVPSRSVYTTRTESSFRRWAAWSSRAGGVAIGVMLSAPADREARPGRFPYPSRDMGAVLGLRCRECSREYPAEPLHVCEFCFAPLEVVYDYDAIAKQTSRESIASGPRSIWRYAPLLPGGEDRVDLGAGMTPLVRAPRLAGELGWAFVNVNIRPYYAEGSKSLAYEVAEQLGWQAPDHVVVPIASGSLLTKIKRGLDELVRVGLLDGHQTRISGAQATGCSPVAAAFKAGTDHIRPVKPQTIAKSLAIGNPADGYYAVKASRETGGSMEDVSDEEVVEGIRLLARTEGIFAETAGGVVVATLRKLCAAGA